MEPQIRRRNRGVPRWVVIVILLDIAILIVAWDILQKKHDRYDSSGFALSDEPKILPEEDIVVPPEPDSKDPARFLDKTSRQLPLAVVPEQRTRQPASAPAARQPQPEEKSAPMSGNSPAERYYFSLLKHPYFRKSKAIQAWNTEFKAYPDLRAIDEKYQRDRNPFAFMHQAAKSPNFQRMLGKYLHAPDIQKFLRAMAGSPAVVASAGTFMKDGTVTSVAREHGLMEKLRGLPSQNAQGQPRLKTLRQESPEKEEEEQ